MKAPLSDRQARFVHEYLIDQNASAAAGRAGYSDKTRGTQAALLMKNPAVRERIVIELADLYARLKLNAIEVLRRQIRAAYLDPAKLFDANQRAIPLALLDEDTRGGLSVTYSLKDDGRQTLHVKQTPRHVALAVLQKRLDAFDRLQQETFAHCTEEDEAAAPASASVPPQPNITPPRPFRLDLKLDDPEPSAPMTLAQADAAIAEAAGALPPLPVSPVPKPVEPVATARLPEPASTLAPTPTPASASASDPVPAPAPDVDPDAPPSPFDPDYNFMKDSDALWGGRYTAWHRYQKDKRQKEQHERERQAALTQGLPPGARIAPGKTVPVRMEPGYNPPWHRDHRPAFAIGAGETYLD